MSAAPPARRRNPRTALVAAALALAAALPTLLGGLSRSFISLDDPQYVFENPVVRGGLGTASLRWALTTFHGANWHPLTWVSHLLDVSLFGLDPRWHHLTSVALHAATTALLFVALARLTGALGASACAAALFGAHPLHVESVAWIAERKDVLSGACFALALLAYERYARRPGAGRMSAVAALLALGLAAKPMLVTLPCVLLLLDFWPLGRLRVGGAPGAVAPGRLLAEKLPLFALAAASSVVTVVAQRAEGAMALMGEVPAGARLANAAVSYATYVARTIWPHPLAVYYPYPLGGHPGWKIGAAALALAAITAAALAQRRRRPFLLVGWLWFAGMLVPVIGLVQVGQQAMADRYAYLPLAGLLVAGVWLARAPAGAPARRRQAAAAVAVALVAALTAAAAAQTRLWRDSVTLFTHTLAHTKDNWVISNNLGVVLDGLGRRQEALACFQEALRVRPGYADAHNNLAIVFMKTGRPDEGIRHFREAVRLDPGLVDARVNLGRALALRGRPREAVAALEEALRIQPDNAEAAALLAAVRAAGR
jgi:hypothetical protein